VPIAALRRSRCERGKEGERERGWEREKGRVEQVTRQTERERKREGGREGGKARRQAGRQGEGERGEGSDRRAEEEQVSSRPEIELRANLKSTSHRCHLFEVAFLWELTEKTIHLPLGCLQGGERRSRYPTWRQHQGKGHLPNVDTP